jgi:hypothetical protein
MAVKKRTDERFDRKGNRRNVRCFACLKARSEAELTSCSCGAHVCETDLCFRGCACTLDERLARQAWRITEEIDTAA